VHTVCCLHVVCLDYCPTLSCNSRWPLCGEYILHIVIDFFIWIRMYRLSLSRGESYLHYLLPVLLFVSQSRRLDYAASKQTPSDRGLRVDYLLGKGVADYSACMRCKMVHDACWRRGSTVYWHSTHGHGMCSSSSRALATVAADSKRHLLILKIIEERPDPKKIILMAWYYLHDVDVRHTYT
jgi:hypothetical protein